VPLKSTLNCINNVQTQLDLIGKISQSYECHPMTIHGGHSVCVTKLACEYFQINL